MTSTHYTQQGGQRESAERAAKRHGSCEDKEVSEAPGSHQAMHKSCLLLLQPPLQLSLAECQYKEAHCSAQYTFHGVLTLGRHPKSAKRAPTRGFPDKQCEEAKRPPLTSNEYYHHTI